MADETTRSFQCQFCNGTITEDDRAHSIIHSIPVCAQFEKLCEDMLSMFNSDENPERIRIVRDQSKLN